MVKRRTPEGMVALTIRQPFASAILAGLKAIEYRSWRTAYRGRLLVHASARGPSRADLEAFPTLPAELPLGALVGVVELFGCERVEDAYGVEYHWRVRNPAAFAEPVPMKGRLGLWRVGAAESEILLAGSAGAPGV